MTHLLDLRVEVICLWRSVTEWLDYHNNLFVSGNLWHITHQIYDSTWFWVFTPNI